MKTNLLNILKCDGAESRRDKYENLVCIGAPEGPGVEMFVSIIADAVCNEALIESVRLIKVKHLKENEIKIGVFVCGRSLSVALVKRVSDSLKSRITSSSVLDIYLADEMPAIFREQVIAYKPIFVRSGVG